MRKIIGSICLLLFSSLAVAEEAKLNNDSFEIYRFSVSIDAHPEDIIPALLNRKSWQSGYESLAHIAGPRWEVGELVEHRWREDDVKYSQREEILELVWEQRLTMKIQRGSDVGFVFYELSPTPTGVDLAVVMLLPQRFSQFQHRQSATSDRVRVQSHRQRLKLEHLQLKKVLELKSLREMQRPPN